MIADRQPLWLDAMRRLLEEQIGVKVVGQATDAVSALALIEEHRPDLFITGIEHADSEAPEFVYVRWARAAFPDIRIIVISTSDDPRYVELAFLEGSSAYCLRTIQPDDLAAAVRQSFEHSVYFAERSRGAARRRPDQKSGHEVALTRREFEILAQVAEGRSNQEVARSLWVTEQTVKFHLSNIYRKLRVANRTQAVRRAQLRGLLPSADALDTSSESAA